MTVDQFALGALIEWGPHQQLGVIQEITEQGGAKMATVSFDDGTVKTFNLASEALQRVAFAVGDPVIKDEGQVGVVIEQLSFDDYPTWKVSFPHGVANVAEMGLRHAIIADPAERIRQGRLGKAEEFNLRSIAADYWFANQHSALVSLAHARVDLKPHQVSVAHRVISNYPHRFMLCDEVGLGKTIEAAMIIKELRARGRAQRVLVLVPPGLMRQWQFELKSKFNEPFSIYNTTTLRYLRENGSTNPWMDNESIIASHTWASWTEERRREISEVPWDMVVVDEAHHARARRDGGSTRTTHLYRLVRDLIAQPNAARRAALLITATPLQLEHFELYSMCDMLNPVLFASEGDFEEQMASIAGLNQTVERIEKRSPNLGDEAAELFEDVAQFLDLEADEAEDLIRSEPLEVATRLRSLHRVSEVLIRNRKSVVGEFQPRHATTWEVDLSDRERRIHELMEGVLERGFARAAESRQNAIGFQMVILQKLLASSSRALLASLLKRRTRLTSEDTPGISAEEAETALSEDSEVSDIASALGGPTQEGLTEFDEVIDELKQVRLDSKTKKLKASLKELVADDPDAKVLVFTEFRETQTMLEKHLSSIAEIHLFHGQLSPEQKDSAVSDFRDGSGPQVLISTEAGGEGRNFQFCHIIVNYDLPWNPMKVEQRIGRVDRIGQESPVLIFNFHVSGTIEGRILEVLERRINIFEEAVGGLDPILGDAEADIRTAVSLAAQERESAMERLALRLEEDVKRARAAEKQAADFIMDAKSFVAEIAQTAAESEAPITPKEFEDFEIALLKSGNTYIGPQEPSGERRIVFHAPFTLERPELFPQGEDARRVCFDPHFSTDSQLVEYLGFGHPIIDALVERVMEHRPDGGASLRVVHPDDVGIDSPGWQFNWIVSVGGLSSRKFVLPVFVPDKGAADLEAGLQLLRQSRKFLPEDDDDRAVSLDTFEPAMQLASSLALERRDEELARAQEEAAGRTLIEKERTQALFDTRFTAAQERISACEATLERLSETEDAQKRQAIPLWQANLARAKSELEMIETDRTDAMQKISRQGSPSGETSLLNIARIELRERPVSPQG